MSEVGREEVHEALSRLNDSVELAQAALATRLAEVDELVSLEERAGRLRSLLLQAIELLRPSHRFAFGSLESRFYDVLSLRYVESMSIQEMCEELSLGRRQVHRALNQAEERLAQVIAAGAAARRGAGDDRDDDPDPLALELTALAGQPAQVGLGPLVAEAASLLAPLAERFATRVQWQEPEAAVTVVADRAVLKQVLVQCLSGAIQAAAGGAVSLAVGQAEEGAHLAIRFRAEPPDPVVARLADAQRIALSQEIRCELRHGPGDAVEMTLHLRRGRPVSVLVVEDNAGATELYRRYLASGEWAVHSLADPRLAFDVIRHNRPDVVVLDIMMPGMDGWSVLGLLRRHPETAAVPVLICSVVDDPELGRALGATGYLKKPVSRAELVAALRRCLAGPPA